MINLSTKKKNKENFLLFIPIKEHNEWIERGDNIYLVFHFDRLIERFVSWATKKPKMADVKLDIIGTKVWQLIDGEKTVYDIGQLLLDEYGEKCQPVYKRLIMYLRYLNKKKWIRFERSTAHQISKPQ